MIMCKYAKIENTKQVNKEVSKTDGKVDWFDNII